MKVRFIDFKTELDIEECDLINMECKKEERRVTNLIRKALSCTHNKSFCCNIKSIFVLFLFFS